MRAIQNPGLLADFIACNVLMNYVDKQLVLEEFDPLRRAELVSVLMERESEVLRTEMKIHKKDARSARCQSARVLSEGAA